MNTLKPKLYTLLKTIIGAETVIWSDQNSPAPALPYWSMRIQSARKIGDGYYSQGVTDLGDQTILGVREATVAVQRFGADSDLKCQELVDNLQKTTVSEAFAKQKINCYETGDVLNVSQLMDKTIIEPRAAVDLFIRFGASITDNVGAIETVEVTGSTDNTEIDSVFVATATVV